LGAANEENARAQVCDIVNLCFIVCDFILYSRDSFVHRKPSPADPMKRVTQPAPSSYAIPIASSVGVTSSSALSAAEAWDFYQWTAEFLMGLKNKQVDQQGSPFTPSLFLSFDLFG
jgi:hypothetical protein